MKFAPLVPRTTLPPPDSFTVAASIARIVPLPVEPRVMVTALLIELPNTLKVRLFPIVRLSPAWLSIRLPTEALMLSFTAAVVVPIVTSTVLLLGTPALQLLALFQLVPSPRPVQLSEVFGGAALFFAATRIDAVAAIGGWLSTNW